MATLIFLLLAAFLPPPPGGTVSGRVVLLKAGAALPDASNAVVWLEGVRGAPAPSRGEMKSEKKKFTPRVVAVALSASVEFPNADLIYHNVFSVSGRNRFDLGLYRAGTSKSAKFEEPGLVRVYCNIHPQMVGFVMVRDSGYMAVTGPDGAFRFDGVPAGELVLKVWHEEGGEGQATVSAAGAPVTVRLDTTNFRPDAHKNKYGKDYPPNAGTDDERY